MSTLTLTLKGAPVLRPGGWEDTPVSVTAGLLSDTAVGRDVDLAGYLVLPGIIDLHGDAFERHLAPRRGAMKERGEGLVATEAELAANGVTTAYLAQFYSWEGGLRGPEFADSVFRALQETRSSLVTDLRAQLRFEIHLLDDYADLPAKLAGWGIDYIVFNDHLPHDRLAAGKPLRGLTAQALKAGRNPDRHLAMLQDLHARRGEVPGALDTVARQLLDMGIRFGSHDDTTAQDRLTWRARGARIAEFPETQDAAETARAGGDGIILGAPNVVRGGSHKGNVSGIELIAMGLCDALASDYHYPSLRRAALMLADTGVLPMAEAWRLISDGPARITGMQDRGRIEAGLRADLVILDADTRRVAATMAGGRISYLSGDIASRFVG